MAADTLELMLLSLAENRLPREARKMGASWGGIGGMVVGWGDAGEEESGYGLLKRRRYEQHVASQRGASSLLVCVCGGKAE